MAKDTNVIKWSGGECPVSDDTIVFYRMRSGTGFTESEAGYLDWSNNGRDYDIVEYYIVSATEPSSQPSKGTMKIYCDNFLALTKALNAAGGDASRILSHNHEFLETLARNRIEISPQYIEERV